jgi:nucleoid DNA-binding protein
MCDLSKLQEKHTAGVQSAGYDYQFYYFVYLALGLKQGQKIGFEVKDDIHVEKEDGTIILFQAKHTSSDENLTTLDSDLWKTLSNWTDFIKADDKDFLKKHSFVLVTNKNDNNNRFIDAVIKFKENQNIDGMKNILNELNSKTNSDTIKGYIENVNSLTKTNLKLFFSNLTIETDTTNIIEKVKSKILEKALNEERLVDSIFDNLLSNIQAKKYLEIKDNGNFEISYEDFCRKFRNCFKVIYEKQPLPKRKFIGFLPDNLEDQIFIKQLLDIGEIESGSQRIIEYTTQMLKTLDSFTYWIENSYVLPTEMEEFEQNNILIWKNKFIEKYREIERKIKNGTHISNLEEDIRVLGIELVDFIRQKDLSIQNYPALGLEISNGHFYALSNDLQIGWHYDWENKYKKK